MSIFKRPIQNVKSVEFEVISWVLYWMGLLFLWAIPVQMFGDVSDILHLLFSFDFIEAVEVNKSDTLFPVSYYEIVRVEKLNDLYSALNVSKVIFWVLTLCYIVGFLFKKPKMKVK